MRLSLETIEATGCDTAATMYRLAAPLTHIKCVATKRQAYKLRQRFRANGFD
jgi:hypothetical protein